MGLPREEWGQPTSYVDEDGIIRRRKVTANQPHVILGDVSGEALQLDPLVKSIPVTDTFHHLGHEGKVFIHSDRHNRPCNDLTGLGITHMQANY